MHLKWLLLFVYYETMTNTHCNECLFESDHLSLPIFKQMFQYAANNQHVLSCFSSIGYDELINIQNIITSKYKTFKNTNHTQECLNIDDHISKISHMESSQMFSSFPIYCSHRKNRFILCNLFQYQMKISTTFANFWM